jgi:hypothetical protein
LADEDFVFEEGKKETMLKKLAEKLGISSPELEVIFAEVQRSLRYSYPIIFSFHL